MPRGDKSAYTAKQKRKARHIEESYEQRGLSEDEAERRAWATVNKQDGGARKKRSTRKRAAGRKTSAGARGGSRKKSGGSSRKSSTRGPSTKRSSGGRKRASARPRARQ